MTDWLMVIITAVYVVATIIICIFNGRSAKAAKEQTETAKQQIAEMIKQYNESNRPIVTIRFDIIRSGLLCFVLENIGPVGASNVKVSINDEFIDNLESAEKSTRIREITESVLYLSSHQKVFIFLGGQSLFSKIAEVKALIDITYGDNYSEHTEIDLWQYRFMLLYTSELEDISHHLKKIEEESKSYHEKYLKEVTKDRPLNVLVHTNDASQKFEVYKAVCLNPGSTTEQISDLLDIPEESTLEILIELYRVDRFIQGVAHGDDDYSAKWYRR